MGTKKSITKAITDKLDYLSEEDASFAVDTIIDALADNLIQGNRIEIRGFGSFSIRERKYAGRIEFYNTAYYRMSKSIFDKLNPKLSKKIDNELNMDNPLETKLLEVKLAKE